MPSLNYSQPENLQFPVPRTRCGLNQCGWIEVAKNTGLFDYDITMMFVLVIFILNVLVVFAAFLYFSPNPRLVCCKKNYTPIKYRSPQTSISMDTYEMKEYADRVRLEDIPETALDRC